MSRPDKQPSWIERVKPLMEHLHKIDARMTWEGYVSLNLDRPKQKDIILQHWYTMNDNTPRYYIVRIYTDGGGWDVFAPVCDLNEIEPTLAAIK